MAQPQRRTKTQIKMIRVLQVNVGVGRAAQDLAISTAVELSADILIISEPYKNKENRWYSDLGNKAAIAVVNNEIAIDEIGPADSGFSYITIGGFRIYSCYCSPTQESMSLRIF